MEIRGGVSCGGRPFCLRARSALGPGTSTIHSMSSPLPSYRQAAATVAAYAAGQRTARPAEQVDLAQAAGRVLAEPIRADSDQPPFARSTRDGFACRAAEVSAHGWLPIAGATRAGQAP